MERLLIEKLVQWKNSDNRKPMILKGARQVGKTWIMKEFGKRNYKNIAYFNFDFQKELNQFFETTKDPKRIIPALSIISGVVIEPEETLIIFDEIQESNSALNSLKYFYENNPEYHIISAGSLLGITLSKPQSFPVGKIQFLDVKPMSFSEFLIATEDKNLENYLKTIDVVEPIPDIFFNPLSEKLKLYFLTGGMPESVKAWVEKKDISLVQEVLQNIIQAYEFDFSKHAEIKNIQKLNLIWKSIPSQLSRENKKFLYSTVKEGARAREYEDALTWLENAGLIYKVFKSSKPGLPISAYDDLSTFKIYISDVGILRRLSSLGVQAFSEGNRFFTEFKGALTENFILQSLKNSFEVPLRYWASNSNAEVDFILQIQNDIFPIEVKAEANISGKSLSIYGEKYPDETKLKVRFSMRNLKLDGDVLNIPLFMVDYTDSLIQLALKNRMEEKK